MPAGAVMQIPVGASVGGPAAAAAAAVSDAIWQIRAEGSSVEK